MTTTGGEVAAGFELVREAFAANFSQHGDVGAAVCVYQHGQSVVDLWGGIADPETGRPRSRDTLQLIYSATKGATATAVHMLAERGELDLDAPVAEYWPEFAMNGKADIPVRWLLSHQALPSGTRPTNATSRGVGLAADGGRPCRSASPVDARSGSRVPRLDLGLAGR